MTASRWRSGASIIAAAAVLAACASDARPSSGITLDTLSATTGTACPLPLDVVASTSGVDSSTPAAGSVTAGRLTDTGTGSVVVTSSTAAATTAVATSAVAATAAPATGAGSGTTPTAPDGVVVSCHLSLTGGGLVDLLLLAGRSGDAGATIVPAVSDAAGLNTDQTTQLGNDMARTKVGVLVAVPGTQAVAVLRTKVAGASSAALMVSSAHLKRGQVEQLARQLDERLR